MTLRVSLHGLEIPDSEYAMLRAGLQRIFRAQEDVFTVA